MIDFKSIELERRVHDTAWIGDPAVDLAASDIETWRSTGEGLVALPGQQLSRVRWRPLGRIERATPAAMLSFSPDGRPSDKSVLATYRECCRFGLQRIDGLKLRWDDFGGYRGISDQSMLILDEIRIPKPAPAELEPVTDLSFVWWLGGVIFEASFRDGG